MKTRYIKPESEIINVKLFGSVLDTGDVFNGSKGAGNEEEAWAKERGFIWEDDEEDAETFPTKKNIWDSEI